jgi:hypothetical protein
LGEINSSFTTRRYKMATAGLGKLSKNPSGPGGEFRDVIVEIGLDDTEKIKVEPDYFLISKCRNQEVKWVCVQNHVHATDGPCFTVDFEKNGSPFYESQFSSDASVSGLARRSVLPGPKIYNYTVRIGDKTLDPGGGVQK